MPEMKEYILTRVMLVHYLIQGKSIQALMLYSVNVGGKNSDSFQEIVKFID